MGGAGSVGQYSIQIAKALGYKVLATCSQKTADFVKELGADVVINYSKDEDDQLHELKESTKGNFFGVWDSVAKSEQLARKALKTVSTRKHKVFATTDDCERSLDLLLSVSCIFFNLWAGFIERINLRSSDMCRYS